MVAQTVDRFGRVDALINNAQTFRPLASVAEVSEDDVDVFYRSGVKGTLWAMQAVYPHMKAQGWGRIVNFASSMGITGGTGFAAYNASKEAIRALTRTAAREWGADGIAVNAIAPAAATHHGEAGKQSEGYRIFIENCPMKRQGDPELDIAPHRVVPVLRRVPLPHRPHVHGRRRRVHVGVTRPARQASRRRHTALERDGYRFVAPVVTRADDFDAQGHLNNAATVRLFNDMRVAYVHGRVGPWWPEQIRANGFVIAAREVHVLYESEGLPGEHFVGA